MRTEANVTESWRQIQILKRRRNEGGLRSPSGCSEQPQRTKAWTEAPEAESPCHLPPRQCPNETTRQATTSNAFCERPIHFGLPFIRQKQCPSLLFRRPLLACLSTSAMHNRIPILHGSIACDVHIGSGPPRHCVHAFEAVCHALEVTTCT